MATFSKAVGGCPTNIAIGTARLGLRSAVITRVGDEPMGRFIREQLAREGVATVGVHTDPERLTALVLLGVRDDKTFPLIFYRDNCADAALDESDVDPEFVASAAAVLVTGTHFARPGSAAAQHRAIAVAREHGRRVVFDVDYRPNLWGLAGHGAGEARYLPSQVVTDLLAPVLPLCDLVVGTEEELHLLGGCEDTLAAIRGIRAVSSATIVCKRGPMGCVVFPDAIPETLDGGIRGPGFPVEVYNVLGAGDAFMSGFLRGWLRGEPLQTCCSFANACGALAVSRLLCSPESPTWVELQHFLQHGSAHRALRRDPVLNHLHRATTRRPAPKTVMALAIDHRSQMEALADAAGTDRSRIGAFKVLALQAALRVANGRPGFGLLLDGTYGREALFRAAAQNVWLARPVELPGSRPLAFEGMDDLGGHLTEWPVGQVVKCLCFYHPDDPPPLRAQQERALMRLGDACRTLGREWLVEIIAGKHGRVDDQTVARVLERLYAIGLKPDWWKLEPQATPAAWKHIGAVIERHDPYCRGVMMLGLEGAIDFLARAFRVAAAASCVRGFAVGRSIFVDAAQAWLAGSLDDETAVSMMTRNFAALVQAWGEARRGPAT
jgi:5-dehydro-2-deoxygluconokinase